jgi:nicotinate phosphoribosyltransferase
MAHSFVTSFDEEIDAFRTFSEAFGNRTVLLIDTYDTLAGAEKAAVVAKEMAARHSRLRGVRLDSGDMVALSRQVRDLFRREGLEYVDIFASGGFDEFKIDLSMRQGAEIDAFGVGTKMGVCADSPYTDMAYKLVQYDGRPVMKLSSGKKTLVAPKMIFRRRGNEYLAGDTIALRDEKLDGEPLLRTVMRGGERTGERESLESIRQRFGNEYEKLAPNAKAIEDPEAYTVTVSHRLQKLQRTVRHRIIEKELGES